MGVARRGPSNTRTARSAPRAGPRRRPRGRPGGAPLTIHTPPIPYVFISYASAEIAQSVDSQQANLDGLVALTKSGLEAANIETSLRDEIVDNVKALADNLATYLPKPGSFSAASFLTPRGVESFNTAAAPSASM